MMNKCVRVDLTSNAAYVRTTLVLTAKSLELVIIDWFLIYLRTFFQLYKFCGVD
jgi:hypothetical protein